MNFAQANQYLLSLGHETLTMKLGLRSTELLLESLGNPQTSYESVQIAGTNGKGSTAVMLDAICRAAGIRAGLYTSPHLVSITERIKIDDKEIAEVNLARIATEVRIAAEDLVKMGVLEAAPTFFEQVTAIALLAFKEANIELAILEVGLGGRLDSTTAVRAPTVAITPISIDHQEYLGETLAEIAAEKAAIIRPRSCVVIAPQTEEARRVILEFCQTNGVVPVWATENISAPDARGGYSFRTEHEIYEDVRPGLRGVHQLQNTATAIALAECLANQGFAITRDAIIDGLQNARHAGRLEIFDYSSETNKVVKVLLDGAHNPAGALALRSYLESELNGVKLTLVFGAMADKQLDAMAALLFPIAGSIILTQPRNSRAAKVEHLAQLATKYAPAVSTESAPASDIAMERALSSDGLVCVTGSLYLVGEVRQWLEQQYGQIGRFR
jgi:dihydrofolate synthase/folylpolyglutamate synthase